ncbi:MAG: HNH endonuclease [Candidatus Dormibacteraeota bacterium]|nr:HNH endonuclease [Candidatus Dormibacteraeota bacterium]
MGEPILRDVDEFLELVVCDLPSGDITGRLKRLSYVRDRLSLAFSKEAARLSAEFRGNETADRLDAPTAGEWIRHNCKMKSGAAYDSISVGEQLPRIAKCAQAMVGGEIGFAHLSVIARTATALSSTTPESVFQEDDILAHARESSAGRLWHYCQRLRHALDPEGVAREQRIAVEERRLQFTVWEDGSLLISGQLDPIGGAALRTALEPLAQPMGEADDRCLERRQGDAVVELSLHSLDAGLVPQHASQRPHLQVTTTLETLEGLRGSPAADMEFSTPISSATVQRLACDGNIARVVFGPDSVVVDVGRAARVVSGATRRALNARDQHCQWPGCERTASWSAAHHLVHWIRGGPTNLSNLSLLCHRHHWMVHEGGWKLARADDGRLRAIAPVYDYYHVRAPDTVPVA